jgi:hypothetical protein
MGFKMNPYDDPEMTLKKGIAKTNVLIAVDEILKITWVDKFLTVEEYWQEVKQEIQKL